MDSIRNFEINKHPLMRERNFIFKNFTTYNFRPLINLASLCRKNDLFENFYMYKKFVYASLEN
jgi:hypothetical protein